MIKKMLACTLALGGAFAGFAQKDVKPLPDTAFSPAMIFVQGGAFQMGDVFGDNTSEHPDPVREQLVDDFYISNYEITFREFDAFCEKTKRKKPGSLLTKGREEYPVVNVSWYDAVEFCNWKSLNEGLEAVYKIQKPNKAEQASWIVTAQAGKNGYCLPTEAEWEFAARQRGEKHRFGHGKDLCNILDINYYYSNVIQALPYEERPVKVPQEYKQHNARKVHQVAANSLGLYGMSGNVAEWCQDSKQVEQLVSTESSETRMTATRALRGGSFIYGPYIARASSTDQSMPPDQSGIDIGFRIVRHPK